MSKNNSMLGSLLKPVAFGAGAGVVAGAAPIAAGLVAPWGIGAVIAGAAFAPFKVMKPTEQQIANGQALADARRIEAYQQQQVQVQVLYLPVLERQFI